MKRYPNRRTVFAALAASVCTFLVMYVTRPEPRTRFVAGNAYVIPSAPLDRVVDRLDCKEVPLQDAIDILSRKTSIAMRLHTQSLESAGVRPDTPVNLHVANLTAGQVLDEIIGSVKSEARLGYWKGDGAIEISTYAEESGTIVTRLYDVRDILQHEVAQSQNMLNSPTSTHYDDAENSLIKYLEDNVATDTWKDNGGTLGVLWCAFGRLIVAQTPRNQDAVEAALYNVSNQSVVKPPPEGNVLPGH